MCTIRPGVAVVAALPSVHRAPAYGYVHAERVAADRATRRWANQVGALVLDVPALVGAHVVAGQGNPDGMHWGWPAHASVGEASAALLRGAIV